MDESDMAWTVLVVLPLFVVVLGAALWHLMFGGDQ